MVTSSRRVRATLTLVVGAAMAALSLVASPAPATAATALGPIPGMVAHPINRAHLEAYEWFNILQVVDSSNRIIRVIKYAGNPTIAKPDLCYTAGGIRVNWDVTYVWQLNYFTRMCAGRGVGTHDIPINRYSGARSMNAADLGKPPFRGAPLSHGCLRMLAVDAKYIYDNFANGTPVYFVKTAWRAGPPPVQPPSPPTGVAAREGDHTALVRWVAPLTHGSAITSFSVVVWPGGRRIVAAATARSLLVAGLVDGRRYRFQVIAGSAAGSSAASLASAPVVPFQVPGTTGKTYGMRGPDGAPRR